MNTTPDAARPACGPQRPLAVAVSEPAPGVHYSTAYLLDSLLVTGADPTEALRRPDVLGEHTVAEVHPLIPEALRPDVSVPAIEQTWRVALAPTTPEVRARDPREVMALLAEASGAEVALDHVVSLTPYYVGLPYLAGVPYFGGFPGPPGADDTYDLTGSYAQFGSAGRVPVAWLAPDPAEHTRPPKRRPTIAVLDTGLGDHPWFSDRELATSEVTYQGHTLGRLGGLPGVERHQAPTNPETGRPWLQASHGTFITGIIRQRCPQARVLSIPVLSDEGIVAESALLVTLSALLFRHLDAQARGDRDEVIDVLLLALGFYHETPDQSLDTSLLGWVLEEFGRAGVAVVVSSGNAATLRPMFPAAFSLRTPEEDLVPQITVGALATNAQASAYFSNTGPWVNCYRVGTMLVSTVPTDLATHHARVAHDTRSPSSINLDDYESGFATWSGTSFAAPVAAADLANAILADPSLTAIDRESMLARGRRMVADLDRGPDTGQEWESMHVDVEHVGVEEVSL